MFLKKKSHALWKIHAATRHGMSHALQTQYRPYRNDSNASYAILDVLMRLLNPAKKWSNQLNIMIYFFIKETQRQTIVLIKKCDDMKGLRFLCLLKKRYELFFLKWKSSRKPKRLLYFELSRDIFWINKSLYLLKPNK